MNDRGEKIVSLAREILEDTNKQKQSSLKKIAASVRKGYLSIKAVIFVAFVAAFGSAALVNYLNQMIRPMNRYERNELKALIFYLAREKSITEFELQNELAKKYKVVSINDLPLYKYYFARRLLLERISDIPQ